MTYQIQDPNKPWKNKQEEDESNDYQSRDQRSEQTPALISETVAFDGMGAPADSKALEAIMAYAARAADYAKLANVMQGGTVGISGLGTNNAKLLVAIKAHADRSRESSAGQWAGAIKDVNRGGGFSLA
ncbi:MAG: hypothetical protein MRY32_00010 [Rickettsiales bacterium]|nr:hypothetical protein [Rickettsiales bacterium]